MSTDRRPVLILDLDGTLVFSQPLLSNLVDREPDRIISVEADGEYKIYMRPHLIPFLNFVRAHFRIGVWTAGHSDYARAIVKHVFPFQPEFVLTRDDCDYCWIPEEYTIPNPYSIRITHPQQGSLVGVRVLKPLHKLVERLQVDIGRILILDDTPVTYTLNHKNAQPLPAYKGEIGDSALVNLISPLFMISMLPDVRALPKPCPPSRAPY